MSLIPYEPFRHLEGLRRDMERMFEGSFPSFATQNFVNPRVDLYETENEVVASCEIPGLVKQDDVQVDIDDNVLTISGSIHRNQDIKEEHFHRKERFAGRFKRAVALPAKVMEDGAKASYKNGILEVRMLKAKGENRKRLDITFQ